MTFASLTRGLTESRLYRRVRQGVDFVTYREVREKRLARPAAPAVARPTADTTKAS